MIPSVALMTPIIRHSTSTAYWLPRRWRGRDQEYFGRRSMPAALPPRASLRWYRAAYASHELSDAALVSGIRPAPARHGSGRTMASEAPLAP